MKKRKPENASEMLDAFVDYITPSEREVLKMSSDEIKSELEAKGINVSETVDNLMKIVNNNQSKSILLNAKLKREEKLKQVKDMLNGIVENVDISKD